MKTLNLAQILILISFALGSGNTLAQVNDPGGSDELVHFSTMDAMRNGVYEGAISIGRLKKYGDFGLGTFDALHGELVALNGVFFQILPEGKVIRANAAKFSPFASVTRFKPDIKRKFNAAASLDSLQQSLLAVLPSKNQFYAIRIHAHLRSIVLGGSNAVSPDDKRGIADLMKVRPVYRAENLSGTFVAFYSPSYIGGIDLSPFHIHFISDDEKIGGHVIDCAFTSADIVAELDEKNEYRLLLPQASTGYQKEWKARSGSSSY